VVWIAPKDQVAAYEVAAAKSAEVGGKAAPFLQAETDRRALEKLETLVEAALAVWADPSVNKGLADFLKKEKTPKTREDAEKLLKYVRENVLQPIKKRNLDQFKGLFGEKGGFPLTEKIVVDAASDEWKKEYAVLQAAAKEIAARVPPEPEKCHGVADIEKPTDLRVYVRGNPSKMGEVAPRRFLRVLAGTEAPLFKKGSGRLELAESIADARNPLTARVMVNRIWQQHFGRGLVATPSNFGALGSRPGPGRNAAAR